jgi:hypothetical protein
MSNDKPSTSAFVDKEVYRKVENDYYSPYIRADSNGTITICVGGQCIFMSIEEWHDKAMETVVPFNRKEQKKLVGSNLRQTDPDYGRREFIRGYNQAKDEIRERIKNG